MSQHDFDIANQTAPNLRSDLNNALVALATLSSGATAPSNTYASMLWYDTSTSILKMRTEQDDDWISIGYFDPFDNFKIIDGTKVTDPATNTDLGTLTTQADSAWTTGTSTTKTLVSPAQVRAAAKAITLTESTWTTGTSTTEALVSPAKVKAVVDNLTTFGDSSYEWSIDQVSSRSFRTDFTNSWGGPIQVKVRVADTNVREKYIEARITRSGGTTRYIELVRLDSGEGNWLFADIIVPEGATYQLYYPYTSGFNLLDWYELRPLP